MQTNDIRFILINTTHPGNIGASARAMKNMNIEELYLVAPRYFPHPEASARSSGAEDILQNAKVVATFEEAIQDCNLIFGTSSRQRSLPIPLLSPRQTADLVNNAREQGNKVAILFGQERTGLTNEELSACHFHINIPCNPNYPSLNLAAAVQIISYELHLALNDFDKKQPVQTDQVTAEEMTNFIEHLERALIKLEFLDPHNPRQLMRKLRRLFNKAAIEQNEMNILRGILTTIEKK